MMGVPATNTGGAETMSNLIPPQSPALPSEGEAESVPMSPVAASSEFGSTPAKSYAAFPRTPGSAGKASTMLLADPPSSRLRHSITMRRAALGSPIPGGNGAENLSFDMGEVELLGSAEQLAPLATPFAKMGQAGYVTVREQERMMDEARKENFDLKLRVSLLQERLSLLTPENIEGALGENVELRVQNEALVAETHMYKGLVSEAHAMIEQLRADQTRRRQDAVDAGEMETLRAELEQTQTALTRAQVATQRYEAQLALFDKESREGANRIRQLELDLSQANSRLSEANKTAARQQTDIAALEEELRSKSDALRKFRDDMSASAGEMGAFNKQIETLQAQLQSSEEERAVLLRERTEWRRSETQQRVETQLASPARNSLDVMESRLLRELGQAQRRVTDLEKQTTLTQSERDQLVTQSRRSGQDLLVGTRNMQLLVSRIIDVAFPGREPMAPAETFGEAVEQVETLCKDVLIELEEARLCSRDAEGQLKGARDAFAVLNSEHEQLAQTLAATEMQLQKQNIELHSRSSEHRTLTETVRAQQTRIRELTEHELPRVQRDAERAQERVRQLSAIVEDCERQLQKGQLEGDELGRKHAEAQQLAVQAQSELADTRAALASTAQQRDDFAARLNQQEAHTAAVVARLEELQSRVGHTEKVKTVVEEQLGRDLKSLHGANGELRAQLAAALAVRGDLTARVDRLSQLLREGERGSDALLERARVSEAALATLRREHDILRLEHKTIEAELADRQQALARLELDLSRLRKDDLAVRRNAEGLEHLQAKVESLTALNAFLKEQAESRERSIRALEDRLRTQQEDMRSAREEVDAQTRKLKKRELLISQALKRLESINHMRQVGATASGGITSMMQQLANSPFRDDHHPSLTPTRPASKRPNLEDF